MNDGHIQPYVKLAIARIFAVGYIDDIREEQCLTSTMADADSFKVSTIENDERAVFMD
jgi:hypothetical protein